MSLRIPQIRFDASDSLAALCKAGGDALRLNVLRALASDSFGVLELAQIFAIGQSGMSHHLKVLTQAGLLATRREGNAVFYRRSLPLVDSLGGKLHAAHAVAEAAHVTAADMSAPPSAICDSGPKQVNRHPCRLAGTSSRH